MISASTAAVSRAGRTRGRTYWSLGLRGAGAQTPEVLVVLTGAQRLDLKCPEESAAGAKSHSEQLLQEQEKLGEESFPPPFLLLSNPLRMPDRRPGIRAATGPAQNRDQTRTGAGAVGKSLAQLFLGVWPQANARPSMPLGFSSLK